MMDDEMSKEHYIHCPFCHEHEFDLVGLHYHLADWECRVYDPYRAMEYRMESAKGVQYINAVKYLGEPCEEYCEGCCCCDGWRVLGRTPDMYKAHDQMCDCHDCTVKRRVGRVKNRLAGRDDVSTRRSTRMNNQRLKRRQP